MAKKVLIVGYKGNMGQRYAKILDHLGVEWVGAEAGDAWPHNYTHCIIATPTSMHEAAIELTNVGVPILCEKPIALKDVTEHVKGWKQRGINLQMVDQYAHIKGRQTNTGLTMYDYFKTGGDGLAWDCINIIGKAEGEVRIDNKSPIWQCWINGKALSIDKMDVAYVWMVKRWLRSPKDNLDYIATAHRKVLEYVQSKEQSFDSDSAEEHVNAIAGQKRYAPSGGYNH